MYHFADFARTKGAKDKQKRRKRLALAALGVLGTGALIYGGIKGHQHLKRRHHLKELAKPLGANADLGNNKDELSFKFKNELEKRRATAKDKDLQRMISRWDKNQAEGKYAPREKYSKQFGGGEGSLGNKFLNSPWGKVAVLGGGLGLLSRTSKKDKHSSTTERFKRIGARNIPQWAIAGGIIGGAVGLDKRMDIYKTALLGTALGGGFGLAKTATQGSRDSLIGVKKGKRKKKR